jgi:hypothetical protein
MYASHTYFPGKDDTPGARFSADDMPILEMEDSDGMSGLRLQFHATDGGLANAERYLLLLEVQVARLRRMIREARDAEQQEAAS